MSAIPSGNTSRSASAEPTPGDPGEATPSEARRNAPESAPAGCYTTARAVRGGVRHLERHVARLTRDAALLGLGLPDPQACRAALLAAARREFPDRDGAVRLEVRAGESGPPRLLATTRELGPEPASWRAVLSRVRHPGPSPWSAAKTHERSLYERAAEDAATAGADDALLADADGCLVEGTRTNLIAVLASGALVTPPLSRGAQAGVGRAILIERAAELAEADIRLADVSDARELIAVNALRGPRPVLSVAGRPVGLGVPGPWWRHLASVFASG
ncbi:aminotransferase class IV [Myxococcota bacterium]|nr:aminotransferase class IV [Myxococcota bacterium]MCZ7620489.1 aminotransferase class IV [Myxococcota bacterium]